MNTAPTASLRWQGTAGWLTAKVKGAVSATDPDGDKLTYTGATTAKGTLTVNSRGSFAFTPTDAARHAAAASNANDAAKFEHLVITVTDGKGGVGTVPIMVEIRPANKAPSWLRSKVNRPDATTGVVTGRISATDGDGDAFAYSVAGPSKGTVVVNGDGTFTYRPTPTARADAKLTWYADKDQFNVTLDDGHGGVRTIAIRVTIAPGDNQSPSFGEPRVSITSTNASNGVITGRINATDPEGSPLTFRLVESVPGGTGAVVLDSSTGAFTFTPTENARLAAYNTPGEDLAWFKVALNDEQTTVTADVAVTIVAKAPAPPPSNWTRPLASYRVTQEYGGAHTGIDLAANAGAPVYAAADGVIYHEGWGTSDRAGKPSDWMGTQAGISILVRHDGLGVMTGYAHLSRTIIDVGQRVVKGQLIGYVGCTGACSGPHLHFEVLPMPLSSSRGILGRVNPRNYLSL
ncbi:peptidoglycan DD-metalloendopeptidase family protein [Mycolicibacterium austroafricanum]|uniref:Ig-like domain-containing protein n=1 Tax=Mycolicibacterium austroafricanum TaxID=39687 RepID=A0ABT8HKI3_MYCAO|nr:M23 family metallopeptidase [Mycolicibacterium austroafricanum]MDN4521249.1 Ig-like domain-containing protein [Mycolicibacterium austroafricanum]QRZ08140.1 peptidoglycan DD-metalloendopeptidase family protein [Mycolicibacterium austroafricanum]QZT69804.1 peptidoglycan DD-metalloendopeptidase family protein [Mycolicibacterium austroafricanum]